MDFQAWRKVVTVHPSAQMTCVRLYATSEHSGVEKRIQVVREASNNATAYMDGVEVKEQLLHLFTHE